MSLRGLNISKSKKLSLTGFKIANKNNRILESEKPTVTKPPTEEEIVFKSLKTTYPIFETLVKEFDLVNNKIGQIIEPEEVESKEEEIDLVKLTGLINKVIEGENHYSKEEIVDRLMTSTKVTSERAETGFKLFLKSQLIEKTIGGDYYLVGSTPF